MTHKMFTTAFVSVVFAILSGCVTEPPKVAAPTPKPFLNSIVGLKPTNSDSSIQPVVTTQTQPVGRRNFRVRLVASDDTGELQKLPYFDISANGYAVSSKISPDVVRTTFYGDRASVTYATSINGNRKTKSITADGYAFLVLDVDAYGLLVNVDIPVLHLAALKEPTEEQTAGFFIGTQIISALIWIVPNQYRELKVGGKPFGTSDEELRDQFNIVKGLVKKSKTYREVLELNKDLDEAEVDAVFENISALLRISDIDMDVRYRRTALLGDIEYLHGDGYSNFDVKIPGLFKKYSAKIAAKYDMLTNPFTGYMNRYEYSEAVAIAGSISGTASQRYSVTIEDVEPKIPEYEAAEPIAPEHIPLPESNPDVAAKDQDELLPSAPDPQPPKKPLTDLQIANKTGELKSIADIYKETIKATYTVETEDGIGSGFSIGRRTVLTNRHVVEGASKVTLINDLGQKFRARVVREFSGALDLAVVVSDNDLPGKILALAPELADIGTEILVIGSPVGLTGTVTGGIISQYRFLENTQLIQIDAAVNPGNSGGPILNRFGHVVGIVTARSSVESGLVGLNWGISSATIRDALEATVSSRAIKSVQYAALGH